MADRLDRRLQAARRSSRRAPLPFSTFGEILAHGLKVEVWCTRCKSWGPADLSGRHGLRFAGARFRCKCSGFGCPSLRPATPVQFAPGDMITDLYCGGCVPPWEIRDVRLDRPQHGHRCAAADPTTDHRCHGGLPLSHSGERAGQRALANQAVAQPRRPQGL